MKQHDDDDDDVLGFLAPRPTPKEAAEYARQYEAFRMRLFRACACRLKIFDPDETGEDECLQCGIEL